MPVIHRKNLNRYRKVYPGIRKPAKYDQCKKMEGASIALTNESSGEYTFLHTYDELPAVTATVYDSAGSGAANTNVFISALTLTKITVETSTNITGTILIQVIEV